jgi:alanine dehydrogenase
VTPARAPIVKNEWIAPGTHIAALGADKGGDQELEGSILQRARIFVDDIRQCRTDGEINVPLSQGLIKEADMPARSVRSSSARNKGGRQIKTSHCSTRPASRCRTLRPSRSSTNGRSPQVWGSKRR